MEKSYPTIAVKKVHDKPVPGHQFQRDTRGVNTCGQCFQPRKQTH
uniref:Uncharacterized protein n=1 Tax=Caenorhabditis japonica TaxID=281687 RepID=A0A8R1DKP8_CAEJA